MQSIRTDIDDLPLSGESVIYTPLIIDDEIVGPGRAFRVGILPCDPLDLVLAQLRLLGRRPRAPRRGANPGAFSPKGRGLPLLLRATKGNRCFTGEEGLFFFRFLGTVFSLSIVVKGSSSLR